MKALFAATFILLSTTIAAQSPMGGGMGGGRGNGPRGGGRPPMMHNQGQGGDNFMIMGLPEIPDLTLEQREKLSKAISDERKDISKLMKEKMDLQKEAENPGLASKKQVKILEKIDKVDGKIKKKEENYDKKYRSILSEEQYNIFTENKKNIEFRGQPRGFGRPQHPGANRQGVGSSAPIDKPEDDIF